MSTQIIFVKIIKKWKMLMTKISSILWRGLIQRVIRYIFNYECRIFKFNFNIKILFDISISILIISKYFLHKFSIIRWNFPITFSPSFNFRNIQLIFVNKFNLFRIFKKYSSSFWEVELCQLQMYLSYPQFNLFLLSFDVLFKLVARPTNFESSFIKLLEL